jgi:hypothetical protein
MVVEVYAGERGGDSPPLLEDMNLLEEMDVMRKRLVSYMVTKGELDNCCGGDRRRGLSGYIAAAFPAPSLHE